MKKMFLLASCLLALGVWSASAQTFRSNPSAAADAEIERQKVLRAADSIEEIRSLADALNSQMAELKKEIADLRAENQKLQAANKTLLDNDKKLEEAIKKVDAARETDRKQLAGDLGKAIEALKKAQESQAQAAKSAAAAAAQKPKPKEPKPSTPTKEQEFYEHTVESGHTLASIARVYEVSVADIQKANDLKGTNIRVGQKLLIPKK